jgi:hypothetical protein
MGLRKSEAQWKQAKRHHSSKILLVFPHHQHHYEEEGLLFTMQIKSLAR